VESERLFLERLASRALDGDRVRALAIALLVSATAHAEPDALVINNCLACHAEEMLQQQRLTAKQWAAVVKKMQGWGAPIEPENVEALVRKLSAAYGPDAGAWKPASIDAAKASAALAPLPDGKWKRGRPDKGKALYAVACLSCHGADGHGSPTGVNLADRPLLWRGDELARVVRKGRGRMPSFPLADGDIASLLVFLRTL
jgi:mono/diheme cytochrome c family protein